jgi:hypothetical protein
VDKLDDLGTAFEEFLESAEARAERSTIDCALSPEDVALAIEEIMERRLAKFASPLFKVNFKQLKIFHDGNLIKTIKAD